MDKITNIKQEIDKSDTGLPTETAFCSVDHERNYGIGSTLRESELEMYNKINIKEEFDILDIGLTNERESCSLDYERSYGSDTTSQRNEFEMDININIKEEDILDTDLPNESGYVLRDCGNSPKNDRVTCDSDFEYATESTECALASYIGFQKEAKCFSLDHIKKIKKELNMCNDSGKESDERQSTETRVKSEASLSNVFQEGENWGEKMEDLKSPQLSRLSEDAVFTETRGEEVMESDNISTTAVSSKKQMPTSDTGLQNENFEKELKQNSVIHEDKKVHKCDICHKCFTLPQSLKRHNLIHEGIKPYKCNVCKKSFTQLSNLKTHKLIHEGKKPHECNICNTSFTQLSNLKAHKLIHEGKKPHECSVCYKNFTRLSDLKIHNLIHDGKKPHECNVCKKRFTHLSSLKRHELIHEGGQPFECNVGNVNFT